MKLNIGCGGHFIPGFTNVDCDKRLNPDLLADITALPIDDNSVEEIYAGHIFEHFFFNEAVKVGQECYRVLEPGGVLYCVVPNIMTVAQKYVSGEVGLEGFACAVHGYFTSTPAEKDRHKQLYDEEHLSKVLTLAGFTLEVIDINTTPYILSNADWQLAIKGKKL